MKILFYFNSLSPAGGIERVVSSHINFLIPKHDVTLVTKDDGSSFYSLSELVIKKSVNIQFKLNLNNRFQRIFIILATIIKTVINLRKILKKQRPDIVYVVHPLCLFELFLSKFNFKQIIVTEHASYNAYNRIYKFLLRILYPKVGLLTVPTLEDSKIYNSIGIKNVYLPNPLPFYPNTISTLQNKLALNIGRFTNDKRHELLIKLWSRSKANELGWKLKIIGSGENYDKINLLIRELNLGSSILISPVTKNIELEYLNSSLFLLTSIHEGFGLVLAEAMSCGVPCLAFNCPSGPKDIITNMLNGYLIEEGDHQLFINRLNELLENVTLRKTFGTRSRFDIQKFDSYNIKSKLNDLIDENFVPLI